MFKHYLATALRHFVRHKVTTSINVVGLALGFVCFALALGWVRFTTSADRYHEKAERTYVLTQSDGLSSAHSLETLASVGFGLAKHLKLDFPDLEITARAFNHMSVPIKTAKDQRFVEIVYADPQLLDVFDFNFTSGDRRGALRQPHSAVITEELALSLFGRTDVVGEPILVANQETVHITGVVGPQRQPTHISTDPSLGVMRFSLLVSVDTLEAIDNYSVDKSPPFRWIFLNNTTTYLVFPESGAITPAQLQEQLPAFYQRKFSDACCQGVKFGLRPVSEIGAAGFDFMIKRDATGISQKAVMIALGLLVLVVSCLNYANLASAQAITRLKEIALHRVVGAHRSQIAVQSCIEALLIALAALIVSLLALPIAIATLKARFGYDIGSAVFTSGAFWLSITGAMVAAAALASSYPAFIAARVRPARAMQGGRVPQSKRPIMQVLVIGQFAMASLLFVSTGVMYAQNKRMLREPSAERDPVVRIDNDLKTARVDYKTLKNEFLRHREIKSVSASDLRPGTFVGPVEVVRADASANARSWFVTAPTVDFDFYSTIGIAVLAGRDFDRSIAKDAAPGQDGNVIIDRALAAEYGWHNPNDAIGKAIYTPTENGGAPQTVIGVVENANLLPIVTVGTAATFYQINGGNRGNLSTYFVRISKDDIAAGLAAIDETWRSLSPNVPIKRTFVDEQFETLYRQVTSITFVFRLVAYLALFIGALGLIGIATHAISQRSFEIGVRRTFGATVRQVLVMLLTDFAKPIIVANLIAWPLAFVAAKAYASLFADRAPLSGTPFILSLLLGLAIAWIAVIRQAARAARLNPATVLRCE